MPRDNPSASAMEPLNHPLETWHGVGFHPHPVIPPGVETRAHNPKGAPPKPGKTPGALMAGDTAWTAIRWHRTKPEHFAHFRGSMANGAGVGVRTGEGFVFLDCDILEPELATSFFVMARQHVPEGIMRVGRAPKWAMLFRCDDLLPTSKPDFYRGGEKIGGVELLARGRQCVVQGIHPDTGKPYTWSADPCSPLTDIPRVTAAQVGALLGAIPEWAAQNGLTTTGANSARRARAHGVSPEELRWQGDPKILLDVLRKAPHLADTSRDTWLNAGRAIKAALPDHEEEAFDAWRDWSTRWEGGENSEAECEKQWRSFRGTHSLGWRFVADTFGTDEDRAALASTLFGALQEDVKSLGHLTVTEATQRLPDFASRVIAAAVSPAQEEALIREAKDTTRLPLGSIRAEFAAARRKQQRGSGEEGGATEDEIAEAVARQYLATLRHDHTNKRDLLCDPVSNVWVPDQRQHVMHLIREAARGTAAANPRAAARLQGATFARGVHAFLRADPRIAVTADDLDRNPRAFGSGGGVLDLPTGRFLPSAEARAERVTRSTAVVPADTPHCPVFLRFLWDVAQGDEAFIRHIQRVLGYALYGENPEHRLVFIWGGGGNGKSVLLNVLLYIFGDYAAPASLDTFAAARSERPSADMAALAGRRLVTAPETQAGRAWDEQRLKAMTGGDEIVARHLYGNLFRFRPGFLPIIAGNHPPRLASQGEAEKRRILIWPFLHVPPAKDTSLPEKLRAEAPAIFRWLLDGFAAWWVAREEGDPDPLAVPPVVRQASEDYFEREDPVRLWLDECATTAPGARSAPSEAMGSFNACARPS